MSSRPLKPQHVYAFQGTLILLCGALIAYITGDRDSTSEILSIAVFSAISAGLFYFFANYNRRNPASPIRLRLQQCCGGILAFLLGVWFVLAGAADGFLSLLSFLGSVLLTANGVYYYVKDRSRIQLKIYD